MIKKFLYIFLCLILINSTALADKFVPDFKGMQTLKCDVNETIYTENRTSVSQNKYFRIFNLDDENKKIYLQKAPIYKINYYENDKLEFKHQHLTDFYIILSDIVIDRQTWKYTSKSTLTYDFPTYEVKYAEAEGICHLEK